jgi:20S proteasome alpha/beta subunit
MTMKISIKPATAQAARVHGHVNRLWLDNYYQDLTYDDLVKLAVEALDAVSDADAKKIWNARKP